MGLSQKPALVERYLSVMMRDCERAGNRPTLLTLRANPLPPSGSPTSPAREEDRNGQRPFGHSLAAIQIVIVKE
jgi:hypothetical protein